MSDFSQFQLYRDAVEYREQIPADTFEAPEPFELLLRRKQSAKFKESKI
jgi:hypothetical protein